MAIFTSKIHENIKRELEKRRNTIDRSYSDYNFLTRIPFIILESNAVRRGSSDDASKYVLRGLRSNNVRLKDYVMLGKRPIAGITSANIKNIGKYGSVRSAVVNFLVWDAKELDLYQHLYMNPGIRLLLQWGYTYYAHPFTLFGTGANTYDYLNTPTVENYNYTTPITTKVYNSNGNYECMSGVCVNFSWQLNANGGFDCSTTILSEAACVYSFKLNSPSIRDNSFYMWMRGKGTLEEQQQSAGIYEGSDGNATGNDHEQVTFYYKKYALQYDIPKELFSALLYNETEYDERNPSGYSARQKSDIVPPAVGAAQVIANLAGIQVNPQYENRINILEQRLYTDIKFNLETAAKYIDWLRDNGVDPRAGIKFNKQPAQKMWFNILAAYNGGIGHMYTKDAQEYAAKAFQRAGWTR